MNGNQVISDLREMLLDRDNRIRNLQVELSELESEKQSIQHTLSLYMKKHNIPNLEPHETKTIETSLKERRKEALIRGAEHHGGSLVLLEVKRAFVAAGLVGPGQNVHWIVNRLIEEMDCWERVKRGVYRLKGAKIPTDNLNPSDGHESKQPQLTKVG